MNIRWAVLDKINDLYSPAFSSLRGQADADAKAKAKYYRSSVSVPLQTLAAIQINMVDIWKSNSLFRNSQNVSDYVCREIIQYYWNFAVPLNLQKLWPQAGQFMLTIYENCWLSIKQSPCQHYFVVCGIKQSMNWSSHEYSATHGWWAVFSWLVLPFKIAICPLFI